LRNAAEAFWQLSKELKRFTIIICRLYGEFVIRTDHVSLKWLMSFKDLKGQLARWSERLQQYDFQVIYRKKILYGNADALSRWSCVAIKCQYCARSEAKEAVKLEKYCSDCIVWGKFWNLAPRAVGGLHPSIAIILQGKKIGIRPSWQEIASGEASIKIYWSYWDSLELRNGVLYKCGRCRI